MEQENIIFLHKGDSWYLSYALNQAKKSNPNANIFLLGDNSNNKYYNIHHYNITDYSKNADSFAHIYQHFSTTDYNHELLCIQRWFIWMEFMQAHNLNSALLPDTDVLIFQDLKEFYNKIEIDFHFSKASIGYMGFVYFKNANYLKKICEFFTELYSKPESLKRLEDKYKGWLSEHEIGGVSDITLFYEYEFANPKCSFNFETPPVNGKAFINSLESPYYKKDSKNYVKIKWKLGIPYATLLNNEKVSIMGAHCFGLQKTQIRKLYRGKNWIMAHLVYYWKASFFKNVFDIIRGRK
jgi:hypothetical protein